MTHLEIKTEALLKHMEAEAKKLGLVFVNGPAPAQTSAPIASFGLTNGQKRGICLFVVAERTR